MKENVKMTLSKNVFKQPVKNNLRTYDSIQKIATGRWDDCTTGCLLQSWTKCMRQTLVFMWKRAMRENFNFYFSTVFC